MRYEDLYKVDPYAYILLWGAMSREGMYPVGTRVVPTEWAIQSGVAKHGDSGIIKGHGRNNVYTVRVLKPGRKHPSSYWSGFWRDIKFTLRYDKIQNKRLGSQGYVRDGDE